MYSEKLENLIRIALADGILSEKGKQVLFKNAEKEGVDLDEFEMVLESRLRQLGQSTLPKISSEKQSALATLLQLLDEAEQDERKRLEQEIEKYLIAQSPPSNKSAKFAVGIAKTAGAFTSAFLSETSGGVSDLAMGAANAFLGSFIPSKEEKIRERIEELTDAAKKRIREKKRNVISTFLVPTSKEDVLELLDYIYPKIKKRDNIFGAIKKRYNNDYDEEKEEERKDEAVWDEKFRMILVRAKRNFSNDRAFLSEIYQYDEKDEQQKRKNLIITTISVLIVAVIIFIIGTWIYTNGQQHSEAKFQEKTRLEQIFNKINLSLKNHDLDEAEYLTNQLVWKYESSWGNCKDEKESWDKERKELIKRIQQIKDPEKANKKGLVDKVKDLFN
jgi:hypothetical protein